MGTHRNEKGYALLVVLLTITIIFSVSAVLASKTITSAKQIDYTDEYTRSIDLAEMGATYARTSIETSLQPSLDEAVANIDKDSYKDSNGDLDMSAYQSAVADDFATNVINTVNSDEKHNVNYGVNQYTTNVSLGGIDTVSDSTIVNFHVNSIGNANINDVESEYPVEFNLAVTLSGYTTDGTGGDSGGESSGGGFGDGYPDESVFTDFYKNPPYIYEEVTGGINSYYENKQEGEQIDSSTPSGDTFYHNGFTIKGNIQDVTFDGNIGINSEMTLNSLDSFTVNGTFYEGNMLQVYNVGKVNKDGDIEGGVVIDDFALINRLDMNNSVFTVHDNLDIGNPWGTASMDLNGNSVLNVDGSLRVGNISVGPNALVNVGGDALLKGNINSPGIQGNMVIKGDASYYGPINSSDVKGKVIVYGGYTGTINDKVKLMGEGSTPDDCEDDGYIYVLNGYTEGGDSSNSGDNSSGDIEWDTEQNGIKYD